MSYIPFHDPRVDAMLGQAQQMQQNMFMLGAGGGGSASCGNGSGGAGGAGEAIVTRLPAQYSTDDEESDDMNGTIPDVSLVRVFKWALVLIVAMVLGEKVWKMFGPKIEAGMSKALDHLNSEPKT